MHLPMLSSRLAACCELVRPGAKVADIGCDHGYLGIHLLCNGIAASVYAADVNEGPLQSAVMNARKFGVHNKMTFYLSDGVRNVPRDFDTLVCAGMGAHTMISILEAAPWLQSDKYRFVLQCQSRRPELRKYLYTNGFSILSEKLTKDGKFIYPIMEVLYQPAPVLTEADYYLSPALLASKSPLLPEFYDRVLEGLKTTVAGLSRSGGEKFDYYQAVLTELLELEESIHGNCQ